MPAPELSVVIPTLNESHHLPQTLKAVRAHWPNAQIVVADGASTDNTVALARDAGAVVVPVPAPSRGHQLRAGAAVAAGEWLLFLHADTFIASDAAQAADAYRAQEHAQMAMFRIRFDTPSLLLRFSAWWTRFDSVFTRFGDQGILVRRTWYDALGGFNAWPFLEDVDFARRSRRRRRVDVLPVALTTSARRFRHRGVMRQQLSNASLLLRFLLGASPHELRRYYPAVNSEADST